MEINQLKRYLEKMPFKNGVVLFAELWVDFEDRDMQCWTNLYKKEVTILKDKRLLIDSSAERNGEKWIKTKRGWKILFFGFSEEKIKKQIIKSFKEIKEIHLNDTEEQLQKLSLIEEDFIFD